MTIWIRRIAGQRDEDWSAVKISDSFVLSEVIIKCRNFGKKHLYKSMNTHEEECK